MRSCVGCKKRAAKSDLLRLAVVRVDEEFRVVPDPRGQRSGRGASLHPDPYCLDLAERRRAFPRAFRLPGPLDSTAVREHLEGSTVVAVVAVVAVQQLVVEQEAGRASR
ncbi:MAG TPA: YlxR family protein [Acidothermaceae bacterium]